MNTMSATSFRQAAGLVFLAAVAFFAAAPGCYELAGLDGYTFDLDAGEDGDGSESASEGGDAGPQ
jgi:hypothetical protein